MRKPNLFIVGAAKSGTSALHYLLAQHPQIYMSEVKEPHFFCKDIIKEIDLFSGNKIKPPYRQYLDYLSLFDAATNEVVIGESSPGYLSSKVAAREIFNFNPNAKIIIIFREPVSFLYSLHSEQLVRGFETAPDFETALSLEDQRKQGIKIPATANWPGQLFYSERVKYYEQLVRYFSFFEQSNIKVIIYDDFKQDNAGIYREVLEFLKVDSGFVPHFAKINVSKKPRFMKLNHLLCHPPFLKENLVYFCPSFYERIKPIAQKMFWRNEPRKPLEPELRKKLMRKYKPEVAKISKLLEIDLVKRWNYEQIS